MDQLEHPSFLRRVFGGRQTPGVGALGAGNEGFAAKLDPLFRPETLRQRSLTTYGRPVAHLPVSWTFLSLLLIGGVVAAITLLASTSYARTETARGLLAPVDGDVQVTAPDRGTIERVLVHEGQRVHQGDVLLTVSTDRAELDGRLSQEIMLASLQRQEADLTRRLSAVSESGHFDEAGDRAQQASLTAAQGAARADLRAAREQYTMAQEDYAKAAPVAARGFISASDMRRRKQAVVAARQAVSDAEGQISSLQGQIDEAKAAAAKQPYETALNRGLLEDTLADLRQQRDQYQMSRGFSLRAPITGRVTTIQANRGELTDAQHPLLSIVPERAALKAVVYVPSSAVGFLHAGQRVRVRYDAFPFAAVGAALGTVKLVSHTVLRPEDVDAAVRLEEPSYRIEISLDRQQVTAYGEQHALLPGMALTADIVLEKRSFLRWLLQPLYATQGAL